VANDLIKKAIHLREWPLPKNNHNYPTLLPTHINSPHRVDPVIRINVGMLKRYTQLKSNNKGFEKGLIF